MRWKYSDRRRVQERRITLLEREYYSALVFLGYGNAVPVDFLWAIDRRIFRRSDRVYDIISGDRRIVMEEDLVLERERIGQPVRRDIIFFRKIGHERSVGHLAHEARIYERSEILVGIRYCKYGIYESRRSQYALSQRSAPGRYGHEEFIVDRFQDEYRAHEEPYEKREEDYPLHSGEGRENSIHFIPQAGLALVRAVRIRIHLK